MCHFHRNPASIVSFQWFGRRKETLTSTRLLQLHLQLPGLFERMSHRSVHTNTRISIKMSERKLCVVLYFVYAFELNPFRAFNACLKMHLQSWKPSKASNKRDETIPRVPLKSRSTFGSETIVGPARKERQWSPRAQGALLKSAFVGKRVGAALALLWEDFWRRRQYQPTILSNTDHTCRVGIVIGIPCSADRIL